MRAKHIPLGPTLVVMVGPSGAGKSTYAEQFSPDEVVSTDRLRLEYLGDLRRTDMDDVIMNEFDRRIKNRLELGLRVVADATHIRDTARRRTVNLGALYGARVIYLVVNRSLMAKMNHAGWRADVTVDGKPLIVRHDETFVANEPSILCGDGGLVRTVIDTRKEVPDIVVPLARDAHATWAFDQAPLVDLKSRNYKGILVVGDIHGNLTGLEKMIRFARQENLFIVFLGDIVDYDPNTLLVASEVARIVFNGWGVSVMGNHERKILKWVIRERWNHAGLFEAEHGFSGDLSPGNLPTVNQIKAMMPQERFEWETRFIGLCATMPHSVRMGQWLFVHGAAGKKMFDEAPFRYPPNTPEESFAMYGETTGKIVRGFPERIYDWVDMVPPRMNVVVGHDCRSDTEAFVQVGAAGGRAVFLDTGSSKPDRFPNGHLTAMSLEIVSRKKIGYVLENERFHSEHDLYSCAPPMREAS